ncbi:hypothetical protein BN903_176 [Halorubrum sp. AJ67]|nr:hypothetical protein BN903_176 [Halorubrum sp. AJ67]
MGLVEIDGMAADVSRRSVSRVALERVPPESRRDISQLRSNQ